MVDPLRRIAAFLDGIGIPVRPGAVPADSFLPGVRISRGSLVYDEPRLRWPGDLLHEAGHLAVVTADRRATMDGTLDNEDPATKIAEVEAIAWSWAALVYLGLPPELLFHDGGYGGRSAGLRLSFELGVCPGAFGLMQAGMTQVGAAATSAGVLAYPHMQRWLR